MATVRIYRVAELLNTSSQEVMALLKRDHGIEVKSASSTIEEVVGRQFVERLARQRGISLPSGDLFADRPAPVGKKAVLARKPEPPKPQAQTLGPPRLVKSPKPAAAAVAEPHEAAPEEIERAPESVEAAPSPELAPAT